jgi:hypothetical protein
VFDESDVYGAILIRFDGTKAFFKGMAAVFFEVRQPRRVADLLECVGPSAEVSDTENAERCDDQAGA